MKGFGFGKATMEESLHQEVQKLIECLQMNMNKPVNLNQTMNISILNALWNILVGEKLEYNDPKLKKIVHTIDDFLRSAEGPTSVIQNIVPFPELLMLPGIKKLVGFDKLEHVFTQILNLVKSQLKDHKATLDEENIRDFMDLYLSFRGQEHYGQSINFLWVSTVPRSIFYISR